MAVVPCSMKTLAGIAHGLSRTLVERAADVMLKERRTLVIVPRETPMSLPQLRNMTLCAEAGAVVMPAMPAFYQMPKTLDDLADFMAGKILSALGLLSRAVSEMGELNSIPPRMEHVAAAPSGVDKTPARIAGMFDAIAAALRPPQSRAQRRPRRALAGARDQGAAASPGRARDRSVHGHGRSGGRGRPRAAVGLGRRRRFRRRDAAPRRSQDCVARPRAIDSRRARRRHAHPARGRRPATPPPSASASATSSNRVPRSPSSRAFFVPEGASRSWSSASRGCRGSRHSTPGTSATCCRSSARPSRDTRAPIPTCRRRSGPSRRPRNSPSIIAATGFSQVRAVPLSFGIVYLYVAERRVDRGFAVRGSSGSVTFRMPTVGFSDAPEPAEPRPANPRYNRLNH